MSQSVDSSDKSVRVLRRAVLALTIMPVIATHVCVQQTTSSVASEPVAPSSVAQNGQPEQWGMFEVNLPGPKNGNPFVDVQFAATFQQGDDKHVVNGFYDGEGVYRVRFMPPKTGRWDYATRSNAG